MILLNLEIDGRIIHILMRQVTKRDRKLPGFRPGLFYMRYEFTRPTFAPCHLLPITQIIIIAAQGRNLLMLRADTLSAQPRIAYPGRAIKLLFSNLAL